MLLESKGGECMSDATPPPTPKKEQTSRWSRFREWLGLGGTGEKTGLDLLQAVAAISIPIVVVVMGAIFTRAQSESQQKAEEQRAQGTALQSYLDQMSELLIDGDLRNSNQDDEVRTLARARTLTILNSLDGQSKGSVMRFLKEAELIEQGKFHDRSDYPIINLYRADLAEADLTYGNLYRTDLFQANLSGADLSGASMLDASLIDADLSGADLSGADMSRTVLTLADLSGANLAGNDLTTSTLDGADLSGANLSDAKITDEQLGRVESLAGATMPDGSKHD
jgi:uncharacterized protein YjbI with pentapeptide repeats